MRLKDVDLRRLSASDVRALRGLCQRGGGPLTPARAERFQAEGLVDGGAPRCGRPECTDCGRHYRLTRHGWSLLADRRQLPRAVRSPGA